MVVLEYILVGLIFVLEIIRRCIINPIFDIFFIVGIIWFIISGIILKKIKDEEKKDFFKFIKLIIRIIFWVCLLAIGVIVNIVAGPIVLM